MGTAKVEGSTDGGSSYSTLWTKSGNKGNAWREAVVNVVTGASKIRFHYTGNSG